MFVLKSLYFKMLEGHMRRCLLAEANGLHWMEFLACRKTRPKKMLLDKIAGKLAAKLDVNNSFSKLHGVG